MSTVMKEEHHENLRLFCEVQGVEKALIQQIVQAVDAPYVASIRDRASNNYWETYSPVVNWFSI
jgi:hypothetical protein